MSRRRRRVLLSGESTPTNWSEYDATQDRTPIVFNSSSTSLISMVNIDETRAFIAYRAGSGYATVRIATVDSAGDLTYGTATTVASVNCSQVSISLLDGTHAIVGFSQSGSTKCVAIEFSGTSISTVGTAVQVQPYAMSYLRIAGVSSTAFYIAYDGVPNPRVYYGTVSGTAVTMGNGLDFSTASVVRDIAMCKLNSTQAIIFFGQNTPDFSVYLIGVSGTTPTTVNTLTIKNGLYTPSGLDVRRIDDNTIIIVYSSTAYTIDSWCQIVTESGGVLSLGDNEVVVNTNAANEQSIAYVDATHAVVTMNRNSIGTLTTVVEISGTTLTPLTTYENLSGDQEYVTSAHVGADWVLVGYEDDNNSSYGTAMVLGYR